METNFDTVSDWFVLQAGFKVYGRCPLCHSPRLSYHKTRRPGLTGISQASKGFTPICIDCGKNLPERLSHNQKPAEKKLSSIQTDYNV